MTFDTIALHVPTILLPNDAIDLTAWAVIACDQYTSEAEYWQRAATLTAGRPSTLNLVFPEVYLEDVDGEQRIETINHYMQQYLDDGTLVAQKPGFILVDRKTEAAPSRKGLMVALDLEQYDFREGSATLIRATEGTILDRLPPRIKVREGATIELPHIMVLIDDPEKTVIEPLFEQKLDPAYDVELMLGGGRVKGWHIDDPAIIENIAGALSRLADPQLFDEKYGVEGKAPVLYAMGDGNHSFATAKAIWEKLKKTAAAPEEMMDHPARYALVELVNVHDAGLEFEAIHRVVFNADLEAMLEQAKAFYCRLGASFFYEPASSPDELAAAAERLAQDDRHLVPFVAGDSYGLFVIDHPPLHLVVATLQGFLDSYLGKAPSARIDYIHGEKAVTTLGGKTGNIGFYLPAISKHDLFKTIILDGALPRKTFSMGEADEKRFYLESRKITL